MHVVLLPGMDGTGLLFGPLIKELNEDAEVRVIRYSADKELSYGELSEYVRGKLPAREEFILVAESYSGPIGYLIASDPPANLSAVVFVATFIDPPNRLMPVISRIPFSILLKLPIPMCMIKHFLLGKDIDAHVIDLFRMSMKMTSSRLLAYRIKEMARLKGGEQPIHLPCTYISANGDKLVSRRHAEAFRRLAPQLESVEISGPHFILQVRPRQCAEVINKYIVM